MAILATQSQRICTASVQQMMSTNHLQTMKNRLLLIGLVVLPCVGFAADLSGTWKSEFDSQIGRQKYIYTLKQDGDKLTGKANSEVNDQKHEAQLSEGKVEGDKVSFVEMLSFNGNDIRIAYSGTISS